MPSRKSSAKRASTRGAAPAPAIPPLEEIPAQELPSGEVKTQFPFPRVTVENGSEINFEIELSRGDITETPSRVILLGQFQGMDPTAAALNLDLAMNGALFQLISLRRSTHGAGELDIIPTGRHPVMAEMVAFLGLGHWNLFNGDVLASCAHSALRSLLASHFDEFATVLMGGRLPNHKEINVAFSLRYMFRGFIQALRDDGERDRFRRVVIVEKDETRLREILSILRVLVQDQEFDGVRTTLCSSELPVRARAEDERRRKAFARQETNLLMLSMQPDEKKPEVYDLEAILHTSAGNAAIIKRNRNFPSKLITDVYVAAGVTEARGVTTAKQLETVTKLVTSLLPEGMLSPLKPGSKPRIELIHDAESSRLPWEVISLPDGGRPALEGGFSRRFVSERAAVIWPPKQGDRLRILMVIDPLGDLAGARKEGARLKADLAGNEFTVIKHLENETATKENLKAVLAGQPFDILHYAGHSGFNRENARFSGLLLHGEEYFTGADVLALAQFPPVVIFNSCEAARIRRRDPVLLGKSAKEEARGVPTAVIEKIRNRDAAHGALSIAEAFLIAGVQHYVGTFWPVNDDAAAIFGKVLYDHLSAGETMGKAITEARVALEKDGQPDWANYIHYGNPDAVVFSKIESV